MDDAGKPIADNLKWNGDGSSYPVGSAAVIKTIFVSHRMQHGNTVA
jgi:hypothetical protein